MKNLCLLFAMLLAWPACAQYVPEEKAPEKLMKNDIGLMANPFLVVLMGGSNDGISYGLVYKRLVADNSRLRFSLSYAFDDAAYRREVPIAVIDSFLYKSTQNDSYKNAELRFGKEWSDFRKANDAIYGVDIIAGHRSYRKQLTVSAHNMNLYDGNGLYGQEVFNDVNAISVQKSLAFGLGFSAGYRATIQKRLEIMAMVSPEVVYYTTYDSDLTSVSDDGPNSEGINFRFRLLDIVMTYRF